MVVDPVCGMTIDENTSQFKSKVNENEVHFCCPSCKAIWRHPEVLVRSENTDKFDSTDNILR
jgi:YHS domain-containing protein